jgi:type I restriction enzyme, S subunit
MSSKTSTATKTEAARPALVPKLRFPAFRDATGWKQTPLGDCLDYQQPTPYLVADTKYSPAYKTPVLTAGKTFILGYTDEQHGIFSAGLPVVIFDDFTTATQFVDFAFKAKSSAMKILEASNGADIKFMYETLQTLSYEVGAHERHWISNFAAMLVPVPKLAEQQKIAECLTSVDELMAAQARKVDALKTHKKGLMQQLFPREGETQPRLRFPEFRNAGDWEGKTLEDIAEIRSGTTPLRSNPEFFADGTIPWVKTTDLNNSFILKTEEKITPKAKARVNPTGSVLVAMYGGFNQIGRTGCLSVPAATNQAISVLVLDRALALSVYVLAWLNAKVEVWKRIASSSRKDPNITGSDVAKFPITLPSIEEQHRIADCLTILDSLISAETQKHEALKTHKKGLMQQLFPAPEEVEA